MFRYFTSHHLRWGVLGGVLVYGVGEGECPGMPHLHTAEFTPVAVPAPLTLYLPSKPHVHICAHTHMRAPIDTWK